MEITIGSEDGFHDEEQLLETFTTSIALSDGGDAGIPAIDGLHCRNTTRGSRSQDLEISTFFKVWTG